jgi:cell division protein FtsA
MGREDIIVGLDIGTTKICAVIGEVNEEREVEIVGVGTCRSRGLRRGVIVNLDSTVRSIESAVSEAELMAGVKVESVYAGLAGVHIKGLNSHGVIAINRRGEVTKADVSRVIDAAKAIAIPLDQEIIHILPQQFIVDGHNGIKDPIGMSGVRLEVEVHIITGATASAQNIKKSIHRAGFIVDDIVLEPLAASIAVLTEDEKELGVVLVDIGGGTTDIVIFVDGSIWHTQVLSIGGNNVTKDISIGLRTPIEEAEKIKVKYGCASSSLVNDRELIEVPSVGGRSPRTLPRHLLSEIITPRMEEIFRLIQREIRKSGYENLIGAGVVLTGGTSMMEGIVELAEQVFDLPVRVGTPRGVKGLVDVVNSPLYATGAGIVCFGAKNRFSGKEGRFRENRNLFGRLFGRIRDWTKEYF